MPARNGSGRRNGKPRRNGHKPAATRKREPRHSSSRAAHRPSKLVEKTIAKIEQAIEVGTSYLGSCQLAGIDYTTYRKWMVQAEHAIAGEEEGRPIPKESQAHVDFFHRIKEAEGKFERRMMEIIEKSAKSGSWQAAAWKLERRFQNRYALLNRHEISGPEGGPIKTTVERVDELTDSFYKRLAGLAHAGGKNGGGLPRNDS